MKFEKTLKHLSLKLNETHQVINKEKEVITQEYAKDRYNLYVQKALHMKDSNYRLILEDKADCWNELVFHYEFLNAVKYCGFKYENNKIYDTTGYYYWDRNISLDVLSTDFWDEIQLNKVEEYLVKLNKIKNSTDNEITKKIIDEKILNYTIIKQKMTSN